VEAYRQTGEHRLSEGYGGGYIWKLYSISRFEQRDGGVYVEVEVIALSRDIPAIMHFIVDPIVRRVSRSSLLLSLQQTQDAVQLKLRRSLTRAAIQQEGDIRCNIKRSIPLQRN